MQIEKKFKVVLWSHLNLNTPFWYCNCEWPLKCKTNTLTWSCKTM